MAMTLLEAAKIAELNKETVKQAIIEFYAGSSSILQNISFDSIPGGAMKYETLDTLPAVGFRGINEAFDEGVAIINPQVESLVIAGGDIDVDRFLIQTRGQRIRAVHEQAKAQALGLKWTKTFLKGDSVSSTKEFDGLQTRITGNALIDAGATSGGDALSLAKLTELVDYVENPTHLIMSKAMRRLFDAAARTSGVSGNVDYTTDTLGKQITTYAGVPILTVDLDNTGTAILPYSEANPGGGSAASTSIYCVSFGPLGVEGLQNGGMDVRDLGEIDSKSVLRTRLEWFTSFAVYSGRAAGRLQGIKNAAITT